MLEEKDAWSTSAFLLNESLNNPDWKDDRFKLLYEYCWLLFVVVVEGRLDVVLGPGPKDGLAEPAIVGTGGCDSSLAKLVDGRVIPEVNPLPRWRSHSHSHVLSRCRSSCLSRSRSRNCRSCSVTLEASQSSNHPSACSSLAIPSVSENSSEKDRCNDVDVAGSVPLVGGGARVGLTPNGPTCVLIPALDKPSMLGLGDATRSRPLSRSAGESWNHLLSDSSSASKLDRRDRARNRSRASAWRRSDALSDMSELEDGMDAHEELRRP